jgi:hypothetical protein
MNRRAARKLACSGRSLRNVHDLIPGVWRGTLRPKARVLAREAYTFDKTYGLTLRRQGDAAADWVWV